MALAYKRNQKKAWFAWENRAISNVFEVESDGAGKY
jgi:hypothetical protein